MKKQALCLAGMLLCVIIEVKSQTIVSATNGNWNSPSTWSGGVVPDAANASEIRIDHSVKVPSDTAISVNNVVVNGSLTIAFRTVVTLLQGLTVSGTGSLLTYGTLICNDGASVNGTTSQNTTFFNGSVYSHLPSVEGVIPLAKWETNATFELKGITGNKTMQSPNWGQTFGNLVYECTAQGNFVEFKGLLKNIAGNFQVRSTRGSILRLANTQNLNLVVGGNVIVEGNSEVWFGASGINVLTVNGDFLYTSVATASSYFATTGQTAVTVNGNFVMDARWKLKFASATSTGHTNLKVKGDIHLIKGTIDALGTGTGTITFNGAGEQTFFRSATAVVEGNISYMVDTNAVVDVGESIIANTTSGTLQVNGILRAGSSNNIQVMGGVVFNPGSVMEYNGSAHQYIGNAIAYSAGVTLRISNQSGVALLSDITIGSLEVNAGTFNAGSHTVNVTGNILCAEGAAVISAGEMVMNGTGLQTIDAPGSTFNNLRIEKNDGADVQLLNEVTISGFVTFNTPNSDLISNGFLTLRSTSRNAEGTGGIGTLDDGNSVIGDVTVERHLDNIGSRYRYISSPLKTASVASLMDDFSVTGVFNDPSTGPGMNSKAPSLFYYNETSGAWAPYPVTGNARDNILIPGRGYSAYVYEGDNVVLWDLTGEINQGEMSLPVTYTSTGNDEWDGWNLVGNPYPCAIQWTGSAGGGWSLTNVLESIAVRDNRSPGRFRYTDGQVGELTGGRIAPGQAFWVKTTGANPTLTINEAAKVTTGAEFYRVGRPADFIEVTLKGGGAEDKAYFRLRDGATNGFDWFDIPKLQNDKLTLSFSVDDMHLAINAVQSVPCSVELPLHISSATSFREFSFSIATQGLFQASVITVYDKVTRIEYDAAEPIQISVTGEMENRFFVRVRSASVDANARVDLPAFICNSDTVQVNVTGAQHGVTYFLEEEGILFQSVGSAFSIPASTLREGVNTFTFSGESACTSKRLTDSLVMKRIVTGVPVAHGGFHCQNGPVTLHVSGMPSEDCTYTWYNDKDAMESVATGNNYKTPVLGKSQTYYVSLVHSSGCEGERVAVVAEIIQYDNVVITFHDGALLSSYDAGNQWYFNGETLDGETEKSIVPILNGTYGVEVELGQCRTKAEYEFVIAAASLDERVGFSAPYPNPAFDKLFFAVFSDFNAVVLPEIFTVNGISVTYLCNLECHNSEVCAVGIEKLPPGIYLMRINDSHRVYSFRFVKM